MIIEGTLAIECDVIDMDASRIEICPTVAMLRASRIDGLNAQDTQYRSIP